MSDNRSSMCPQAGAGEAILAAVDSILEYAGARAYRRWRKSIRYLESGQFVRFQGNLLREHNVSGDKIAEGNEAKPYEGRAFLVNFLHIG
jgi:hypothetical protein